MDTPRWLSRTIVDAIHDDQLQQHGDLPGVQDDDAIESALARPKHLWTYGETADLTLSRLAAAYGTGLTRNHGPGRQQASGLHGRVRVPEAQWPSD